MKVQLGVDPRSKIRSLRMLRCKNGSNFELFEYEFDGASTVPPKNSDVGGSQLGLYVDDIAAAVEHLKASGIVVQGEGPSKGLSWGLFPLPWGMQLELVSAPQGEEFQTKNLDALWSPVAGR